MKLWKKTITAIAIMAGTNSAYAELPAFDITIEFGEGLSESQQAVFSSAESYWENTITNYAYNVRFEPGLTIAASGEEIDGQSGILGQAGPTVGNSSNGTLYATEGTMRFDTADLDYMETQGTLFNVILHEMAHVIGYGSLWDYNGLYTDGTGQYIGANALSEYKAEFDPNATYIPIELDGGEGTEDAHWDENWAGGSEELMTGWLNGTPYISNTTLAQFVDLGYVVDFASLVTGGEAVEPGAANNVPSPYMNLAALALLGLARRKKHK
ncbi:hypothetical protein BM525_21455 (plasmid) [Alteromonas mediterranea]|uniref:Peptidase n=1 Tax=Alteromonas mediterranea TaxID=314275 RepID=A0AAC9JIC5_9ALTE|nr:leishmanolysin-related zinc metalloendopeptidase [Alteromonas mediterranea]APD92428.1 hypothetical protein BM524_21235 [Alteromonas mediterranea]APE00289.1 hypothetical protein BM525_21455 [Alteromonas mediterranea]